VLFRSRGARLIAEAREIFARLGARPWLDRADAVAALAA